MEKYEELIKSVSEVIEELEKPKREKVKELYDRYSHMQSWGTMEMMLD